jgi:hypothetical protein
VRDGVRGVRDVRVRTCKRASGGCETARGRDIQCQGGARPHEDVRDGVRMCETAQGRQRRHQGGARPRKDVDVQDGVRQPQVAIPTPEVAPQRSGEELPSGSTNLPSGPLMIPPVRMRILRA